VIVNGIIVSIAIKLAFFYCPSSIVAKVSCGKYHGYNFSLHLTVGDWIYLIALFIAGIPVVVVDKTGTMHNHIWNSCYRGIISSSSIVNEFV